MHKRSAKNGVMYSGAAKTARTNKAAKHNTEQEEKVETSNIYKHEPDSLELTRLAGYGVKTKDKSLFSRSAL
jgi:hypothetical protein